MKWMMAFLVIFTSQAHAHPLDVGLLQGKIEGNRISFRFQLDPNAASEITGVAPEVLKSTTINLEKDILFVGSLGAASVYLADGQVCSWQAPSAEFQDEKVSLIVSALCPRPVEFWSLKLPFFERAPKTFEVLAKIESGNKQIQLVATTRDPYLEVAAETEYSLMKFINMGIHHIGAAPSEWRNEQGFHFPEGIDHILFVFALVLGGGGFIGILKTVTGFTLGHSLTLAMASLHWVHVPSRLVESAIALSISIVAAESIFSKNVSHRWKIAMAFGLVHGLGFASALTDLKLSSSSLLHALIGFNIGVETGQTVIVAVLLPFIYGLGKTATGRRFVLPSLAVLVFCVGGYWFIQRAFGI